MVMPMSTSEDTSMFPPSDYDFSSFKEWCRSLFKVKPRPTWVTTEFGGHVRPQLLYVITVNASAISTSSTPDNRRKEHVLVGFLTNHCFAGYRGNFEEVWKQHHLIKWIVGSLEWRRVWFLKTFLVVKYM